MVKIAGRGPRHRAAGPLLGGGLLVLLVFGLATTTRYELFSSLTFGCPCQQVRNEGRHPAVPPLPPPPAPLDEPAAEWRAKPLSTFALCRDPPVQ